jgi:hypothetical protein
MAEAQHQVKNLVSNQVKQAAQTDPLLVNGWGLVHGPGTPWWISDNNSGWSTLYDGSGKQVTKLKVLIPTAGNGPSSPTGLNGPGSPTGTVFNGSSDFQVQAFWVCTAAAFGRPLCSFQFSEEEVHGKLEPFMKLHLLA